MKRASTGILALLCSAFVVFAADGLDAAPWRSTGPEGGWVTALHLPYGVSDKVLAGTYGGGVYYSQDGGESWLDIQHAMRDYILVDFVSTGSPIPTVWAATAEGIVYRSNSLLNSWDFASAGLGTGSSPPQLTGLAVDPLTPQNLAASAYEGLWLTDTAGAFWPDSLFVVEGLSFTDVEITQRAPTRYYAAATRGIYRSDDARIFIRQREGLVEDYIIDMDIWPGSVDSLLVAYLDRGLYLSEDGATFRYIGPTADGADAPLLREVECMPSSGEIFLCSEIALHYTADLGAHWQTIREPGLQYPEYWSLAEIDAVQRDFLVGSFGRGVLRTRSDGPWSVQNSGLIATWVVDLAVDGELVLAATRNGRLYRSLDGGESWADVTGSLASLGVQTAVISADGSRWLVGTLEGVWYSDDEGTNWSRPRKGFPAFQLCFELLSAPTPAGEMVYIGTSKGVYSSRDFGEEWKLEASLPLGAFQTGEVDPSGAIWWGGLAIWTYRAEAAGEPFAEVDLGAPGLLGLRGMAFDPQLPETVYWASSNALLRWTPGAGSVRIDSSLPETEVRDMLVLPDGRLVVGLTVEGVFASGDQGKSWMDWNEGLAPTRPRTLAYRSAGTPALLTGTFAKGVFVKTLDPAAVPPETARVRGLRSQPNPFNPRTQVRFRLERPSHARVEVIDQRGRRVALLHQGPLPAGEIEMRWDATDSQGRPLASGVYHVRVDAEGEIKSLPLTLLR